MHVTLRSALRPLRSQYVFPTVRRAIAQASRRSPDFRVVHFSVQEDHVHLLVEAAHSPALSAGMRGLVIRIARQVNKLLFRRGRVWSDRWHGRALTSPRAVRHAIVYVLANFRKHEAHSIASLDPYSSAPDFEGFREYLGGSARMALRGGANAHAQVSSLPPPLPRARTWLLAQSWRKRLFSVHDRPRGS
ncbi:MAG TPA: transposase [Polyangiaceae bacterium]|nr:transposase [Polyangiaceae bacterium]